MALFGCAQMRALFNEERAEEKMDNDMLEAYLFEMNTLLEQIDELVLGSEKAGTFTDEDVNEIFRITP